MLLVFSNNQYMLNAMNIVEITKKLGLHSYDTTMVMVMTTQDRGDERLDDMTFER